MLTPVLDFLRNRPQSPQDLMEVFGSMSKTHMMAKIKFQHTHLARSLFCLHPLFLHNIQDSSNVSFVPISLLGKPGHSADRTGKVKDDGLGTLTQHKTRM